MQERVDARRGVGVCLRPGFLRVTVAPFSLLLERALVLGVARGPVERGRPRPGVVVLVATKGGAGSGALAALNVATSAAILVLGGGAPLVVLGMIFALVVVAARVEAALVLVVVAARAEVVVVVVMAGVPLGEAVFLVVVGAPLKEVVGSSVGVVVGGAFDNSITSEGVGLARDAVSELPSDETVYVPSIAEEVFEFGRGDNFLMEDATALFTRMRAGSTGRTLLQGANR